MSTITSDNFLNKLCFCALGCGLEDGSKQLKGDLLKLAAGNKKAGIATVARPTIYKWFDGSGIRNSGSLQFLLAAIPSAAALEALDRGDDRKKVANQLRSFCKKHIPERQNSNIRAAQDGWIHLRGLDRFHSGALAAEADAYVGTYRAFKVRSGAETQERVSIEYFSIFKAGPALAVDWWFLIDGRQREKFEGVVYFMGEWLWMVLHSPRLGGRFRHVCLDGRAWGRRSEEVRGGLILSTSPQADPFPSATRVASEPCQTADLDTMKHVRPEQVESAGRESIVAFLFDESPLYGRLDASLGVLAGLYKSVDNAL